MKALSLKKSEKKNPILPFKENRGTSFTRMFLFLALIGTFFPSSFCHLFTFPLVTL